MKKRILIVALCLAMVLSMVPTTVFATEPQAKSETSTESSRVDVNVLADEVKKLMNEGKDLLNSGKEFNDKFKEDMEQAQGMAELGLLSLDVTTLTQVKSVFQKLISTADENVVKETVSADIDALIEEIEELKAKVDAILSNGKNYKESYINDIESSNFLYSMGVDAKDFTTLTQVKEAYTKLIAEEPNNVIEETTNIDKLIEDINALKEQVDAFLKNGKNYQESFINDINSANALYEIAIQAKDETTLGQVKEVYTKLINEETNNVITEEPETPVEPEKPEEPENPEVDVEALIQEVSDLVKQAEEILNNELKEEYKGNLVQLVEIAKMAISTKDVESLKSLKAPLADLVANASENIIPKEPEVVEEKPVPAPVEEEQVEIPKDDDTKTTISVISDTHVLPEDMIAANEAFEKAIKGDRKLFTESEGLFRSALEMIKEHGSDLVFLTGDITKDGEYKAHVLVSSLLKDLQDEKEGRRIFITPGNHDINNTHAVDYNSDGNGTPAKAQMTTPEDFLNLYNDLVFARASSLYKDSNYFNDYLADVNNRFTREDKYKYYGHGYTSYASHVDMEGHPEGINGMTVVGLDTAQYSIEVVSQGIDGVQNTKGIVTNAQLSWLVDIAEEAAKRNDIVMVLSHHAFMPHFNNQEIVLADYIIENWDTVIESSDERINGKKPYEVLADYGINFLFTGHMHAQDIAKAVSAEGNTLYDIETGSTVTYPLPVRHITVNNSIDTENPTKSLDIKTELIKEFEYTNLEGEKVVVKDATAHAAQNLITHDLVKSVAGGFLPSDIKSRELFGSLLGQSDDVDGAILSKLAGMLGSKDQPFVKTMEAPIVGSVDISIYPDEVANADGTATEKQVIINVKGASVDFNYYVTFSDLKMFLSDVLDEVDKVLSDKAFINSVIDKVAKEAFEAVLYTDENGNTFTLSEVANEAYLSHLRGDEKRSDRMNNLIVKYTSESLVKELLTQLAPKLDPILQEVGSKIEYKMSVNDMLKLKDGGFLATIAKGMAAVKIGNNLAQTLTGLGFNAEKILGILFNTGYLDGYLQKANGLVLGLIVDLTSEDNPAYKDYAYLEDNNTVLTVAADRYVNPEEPKDPDDSKDPEEPKDPDDTDKPECPECPECPEETGCPEESDKHCDESNKDDDNKSMDDIDDEDNCKDKDNNKNKNKDKDKKNNGNKNDKGNDVKNNDSKKDSSKNGKVVNNKPDKAESNEKTPKTGDKEIMLSIVVVLIAGALLVTSKKKALSS